MENKQYFMRVVRKDSYDLRLDSPYLKCFKELAKIIYGDENTKIRFGYGTYGGEFFSHDLSYFEATNNYTNYVIHGITKLEVYEIIDESKVSIHPAYAWSDCLYQLLGHPIGDEDYIETFKTIIENKIVSKTSHSLYSLLDQVVFKENLEGVKLIESKNMENASAIELEYAINYIANKYKLTY